MSKTLADVARAEFDSMVKQSYQGMGLLKPYVTIRNNVVGDTYKFRKIGKGLANQKSTSDLITPMDAAHTMQTATLGNWNAGEYTDIFDQQEVNFDEKQELAELIAGALGRRTDQLIVDALDASTPDASTIDAGAANLALTEFATAQASLRGQGVPNSDLVAVIEAGGLGGLLRDEKATSADYQQVRALVTGDVNSLAGFRVVVLEDRDEGGLTEAASKPDAWFFHKSCVGLAIGFDMSTSVDWIADRTAWLTNGKLKAGAVVRDTGGLVKVQYTKTAA